MARGQTGISLWINNHLKADAPRSRSLIVTIFGDSVAPYSEGVWLSDLIDLLAPFGANERLVRTSVFRLTEEAWLVARRDGRRSFYTLAPGGRRRFQQAYDRVYTPVQSWDGVWTVVILPKSENGTSERAELRRELEWEGYAFLAPGIFIRPSAATSALTDVLKELDLVDRAVVFQTRDSDSLQGKPIADLTAQCWDLRNVRANHALFVERFKPLLGLVAGGSPLSAEQAFVVQTLVIDSFRRVTLHDPRLPEALLPRDWPGQEAYQLCRDIYRRTYQAAREHLTPRFNLSGSAAKAPAELLRRFGGLD